LAGLYGSPDVRRWGRMPRKEPRDWLQVAITVAVDWRFVMVLAILIRVLLNR
jgi:hypothetical protein